MSQEVPRTRLQHQPLLLAAPLLLDLGHVPQALDATQLGLVDSCLLLILSLFLTDVLGE